MKILIAPDKFKGSMTAQAACRAIINGLKTANTAEFIAHPLADGGEGTIDILAEHMSLQPISLMVANPLGQKIEAHYYLVDKIAFIELAVASGLLLLSQKEQNPMFTSTLGFGQLIEDAIKNGAQDIYLFVGGSATNDGGMGLAHALGYRFLDKNGSILSPTGQNLGKVVSIDHSLVDHNLEQVQFTMLSDVANPLLNEPDSKDNKGAAYTYAAQKGATQQEIQSLEQGMKNFSTLMRKHQNDRPMGFNGAAGGVSVCLVGLLNAQVESGAKKVMELTNFEQQVIDSDWIISGEGQLDLQSFDGKVISEVAKLAQKHDKPLFLMVGRNTLPMTQLKQWPITNVYSLINIAKNQEDAILNGAVYLSQLAQKINFNS